MSISDSTNRQPSTSMRRSTLGSRAAAQERTTREFAGDLTELPPLAAGEVVVGRYTVLRALGRGGFSDVYLAQDRDLDRQVAMKRLLLDGLDAQLMRDEAKILASLDHPSIVRIFDICQEPGLGFFMLMQYVAGPSLRELMLQRLPIQRAVEIAIRICGGLIHAHSRGVVHRDIKPTNIIMSNYGEPLITDFGLALTPTSKSERGFQGGTPRYMSPEQIRQETNRLSPTSDIFSTGIVLYEMLCGRVPFNGASPEIIANSTLCVDPTPLTVIDAAIPEELDRICRHALRKNVKDRYGSMEAFQADLIRWLRGQESTTEVRAEFQPHYFSGSSLSSHGATQFSQVTLRGLQPFEEEDGDFYLSLIPGATAPSGLPDSLQFWKGWIESFDNNLYSRVGILYGPCGSGKTSFLKAGIKPHLAPDILPICIECRAGDLHAQVAQAVSGDVERAPGGDFINLLKQLRNHPEHRHEHRKVVLLLDQFEAWAGPAKPEELQHAAAALRQCDGEALQVLLVIRDDYWVSATEFLHLVECGVEQWKNARAVELIDRHHARRLLEAVGRSYGSLPALPEPLEQQHTEFLDRAIDQMVFKGRIVPIQLAMFMKMAKLLPWHPETLTHAGETQGIYVNLFQDLFEGQAAPPVYQRVRGAVADILQRLLPATDQTTGCAVVALQDLEEAATWSGRENQVHRALQILIEDLRLVIRVATPAGAAVVGSQPVPDQATAATQETMVTLERRAEHYQLANDFLIEPVRLWVTQVHKSDWRGRVKSRLEDLSAIWGRRQEQRYLPTLTELLEMQIAVPRKQLNAAQRAYLRAATRVQASVCSMALGVILILGLVGWYSLHLFQQSQRVQDASVAAQVDSALHGDASFFPVLANKLSDEPFRVQKLSQPWLFASDPVVRTRAKLLYGFANEASFEQIVLDFPVIEPALGPSVLKLAQACPDSTLLVRQLYDSCPAASITQMRAAITLAYLGELESLCQLLDFSSGGDVNDLCFHQALTWRGGVDLWSKLLQANYSSGANYHALGVLASYPEEDLPADFSWYRVEDLCQALEPSVRGTANWFLQQAGRPAPDHPVPSPSIRSFSPGIELVRIDPGTLELKQSVVRVGRQNLSNRIEFSNPIWISQTAITNRQFEPFLHEIKESATLAKQLPSSSASARAPELEKNPDRPVTGYEIEYLYAYCNWLSCRAGLAPAYQAVPLESQEGSASADGPAYPKSLSSLKRSARFTLVANANGFRLPTARELVFAFSATSTEPSLLGTPLGIKEKRDPQLIVDSLDGFYSRSDLARDFIPNRFGVHFMEYCYMDLVEDEGQVDNLAILQNGERNQYMLAGGAAMTKYSVAFLVQGPSEELELDEH